MTRFKRFFTPKESARWAGHIRRAHQAFSCCMKLSSRKQLKRLGNRADRTKPKDRPSPSE